MKRRVFQKPPAKLVRMAVQFANNLAVSDDRDRFYQLIRNEFPLVVMPEIKNLTFNFGDYSVQTANETYRLEIGMNYFRAVALQYRGFEEFRALFRSALGRFSKVYSLDKFASFAIQYTNELRVLPGKSFEDCFTVRVTLPDEINRDLSAAKGVLIFTEENGNTLVDFDPVFDGTSVSKYNLTLTYSTYKALTVAAGWDDLDTTIAKGHENLSQMFFNILTEEYLRTLE